LGDRLASIVWWILPFVKIPNLSLLIGPFEFPTRLTGTGARYAQFIGTELPVLLETVPLAYRINDWLQHDGAPPRFSRNVR
jgi:hypothetical protein